MYYSSLIYVPSENRTRPIESTHWALSSSGHLLKQTCSVVNGTKTIMKWHKYSDHAIFFQIMYFISFFLEIENHQNERA